MRDFESEDGVMLFAGLPVTELADRFGTPVYVTDEQRIRDNYRRIRDAFAAHMDTRVHYACKANSNLAVLGILNQEGSGIDAVSAGEVAACIRAGIPPERIMYTGVNVSDEELRAVTGMGVMINIDSESALERLAAIDRELPVSFRITPDVGSGHSDKVITGRRGSKFGIPRDRVIPAYLRARDLGFDIRGIHAHIGSGGQAVEPFTDLAEVMVGTVNRLQDEGIDLEFIDIGGGIGIPYRPNEEEMDLEELAFGVTDLILDGTDVRTLIIEPGRYIVCDSTVLLTRCVDCKDAGIRRYIGVDAGFNTLARPAMYGSYHHVAIGNRFGRAATAKYDVAGPICESGDILARDRALPDPSEGDVVVVYDTGAYGFSMSSNYNSRPLCAEVLVNDGEAELIRRHEDPEDLWRNQIVPGRLQP
jgi:diaminopimelate decarboxylase